MSYPKTNRATLIAAKVEAVAGTPETASLATDCIRLLEPPSFEPLYLAENELADMITGGIGVAAPATPAGESVRVRGRVRVIGAGAAYSATVLPEMDPLLRTLFGATVVTTASAEKVTYALASDPATTATVVLEKWGKKITLTAAVLDSLRLSLNPGQFGVMEFSLVGLVSAVAEQALETATYDQVAASIWKGSGALTVGAYSPVARAMELDFGIEVEERADANAADGHAGYKIVRVNPVATVRAEIPAIATWDPRTDKLNRTSRAVAARVGATGGGGQYKRMNIASDGAVLSTWAEAEDGRLGLYALNYTFPEPAAGSVWCDLVFD